MSGAVPVPGRGTPHPSWPRDCKCSTDGACSLLSESLASRFFTMYYPLLTALISSLGPVCWPDSIRMVNPVPLVIVAGTG